MHISIIQSDCCNFVDYYSKHIAYNGLLYCTWIISCWNTLQSCHSVGLLLTSIACQNGVYMVTVTVTVTRGLILQSLFILEPSMLAFLCSTHKYISWHSSNNHLKLYLNSQLLKCTTQNKVSLVVEPTTNLVSSSMVGFQTWSQGTWIQARWWKHTAWIVS